MTSLYDNLGSPELVPTVNRQAAPDVSKVQPADWSVLGLVDGKRTLAAIGEAAPLTEREAVDSLTRLRDLGMIDLPRPNLQRPSSGMSRMPIGSSTIRPTRTPSRSSMVARKKADKAKQKKGSVRIDAPVGWPIDFDQFMFDPLVLEQEVELSLEKRKQLLYFHYHLERVSYYELFQVPPGADERTIRRSYFKLSKEFHPDQFFRKELGEYKEKVSEIFKWVSEAYMTLSNPDKRAAYDAVLSRGLVGPWQVDKLGGGAPGRSPSSGQVIARSTSTPARGISSSSHVPLGGSDLLDRGRALMDKGDWPGALRFFEGRLQAEFNPAAAVYAARCLLETGGRMAVADSYCRRAIKAGLDRPTKRDAYVVLARILERAGRVEDARKVFVQAQRLAPDDPTIREHLTRIAQRSRS